ncbi:hypothetical protein Sango_2174800 [Sesamum angolense]|uniref:Glycine-rich protein n=1 Tax=Sesamum angolense TaxID=2727404 RepID=A0AAE2BMT8_9LAMI|nr:hypothetical protein Sango_2174800 [Sesamum angolense]
MVCSTQQHSCPNRPMNSRIYSGDYVAASDWIELLKYSGSERVNKPRKTLERVVDAMAYVERGVVKSKRSIWRLRTITDFFWAIINFIAAFFATMFSMEKTDAYRKGSGASKKWDGGGPGGPGSGPYGGGPRGPPRGMDNVRGIDHSSLPACGSCCGG